jgi:DNA-binding NarL/FixJ family response regulator
VDDAIEDLRECGRRTSALVPWRSLLAHALLDRGPSPEARRLAADELARTRRFGAPRATGVALRAAARVAGGEEEIALLREATAVLDGSEARLERARTYAALGVALRRGGEVHEAREALRAALDLAHACGATALERRTLTELRAAGARPRRLRVTGTAALTGSERRIAELAAAGHRNREIAETLVVTLATVEYHLRHTYRKLGIAGRAELGAALAA